MQQQQQRVKMQHPQQQQQQSVAYLTSSNSDSSNAAASWHTPTIVSSLPGAVSPPLSGPPGDTFKILLPKMGGPVAATTIAQPPVKKELTMGNGGGGESMTITEVKVIKFL
jgi:hypothetical protein